MGLTKGIPRGFSNIFQGKIINYNIDSGKKGREIPFIFSPSSLSDSVQASFQQQAIPGSSGPQITYSSTGARTVSMSLSIPLDYIPPSSYSNIEDYLDAFRALVYPKYHSGSGMVSPPHCRLITTNLDIDGVCATCNVEYKTDRYANDGSMAAEVSLSFIEILENVQEVDTNWVINRTKKITTAVSSGNSGGVYNSDNTEDKIQEERSNTCTITLKGDKSYTIESTNPSLRDNVIDGVWSDPGYTYTKQGTYKIFKLYAFLRNEEITSVQDIAQDERSKKYYVRLNGKLTEAFTYAFNGAALVGDTANYVIVYVPYKDGGTLEQESLTYRLVTIKVVRK